MEAVYCRSTSEIMDDQVCEIHTSLAHSLNAMACGQCLYVGKRREEMKALLAECEAYIESGRNYPDNMVGRFRYAHKASRCIR
jgi:hypothetical protein